MCAFAVVAPTSGVLASRRFVFSCLSHVLLVLQLHHNELLTRPLDNHGVSSQQNRSRVTPFLCFASGRRRAADDDTEDVLAATEPEADAAPPTDPSSRADEKDPSPGAAVFHDLSEQEERSSAITDASVQAAEKNGDAEELQVQQTSSQAPNQQTTTTSSSEQLPTDGNIERQWERSNVDRKVLQEENVWAESSADHAVLTSSGEESSEGTATTSAPPTPGRDDATASEMQPETSGSGVGGEQPEQAPAFSAESSARDSNTIALASGTTTTSQEGAIDGDHQQAEAETATGTAAAPQNDVPTDEFEVEDEQNADDPDVPYSSSSALQLNTRRAGTGSGGLVAAAQKGARVLQAETPESDLLETRADDIRKLFITFSSGDGAAAHPVPKYFVQRRSLHHPFFQVASNDVPIFESYTTNAEDPHARVQIYKLKAGDSLRRTAQSTMGDRVQVDAVMWQLGGWQVSGKFGKFPGLNS
ncbi:unnamed protein product, partial [Amoebophrya sp. A120]|eukprot:GSA120T00020100001.1